jgi:hypothetical protein
MIFSLGTRILRQVDFRLLWKLGYNLGWKGMKAVAKHKKRLKNGEMYPAFMMISVTDNCNLNCQGCWVTITNTSKGMDLKHWKTSSYRVKRRAPISLDCLVANP